MNYETQQRARLVKRMEYALERSALLIQRGQNARALWWAECATMYENEIQIHDEIFGK